MKFLQTFLIPFLTIATLSACNEPGQKSQDVYQTAFVQGSTNNKIEVLDFGGTGQPILFLTGLGNSAHVFVDFAPKFTDKYHVYAMTRRGYGASEQTVNGYRVDTLANDILSVITALKLDKVILIGHSIAGDEISKFASTYPDKADKVVYLDAGYDRSNFMATFVPYMPAYPNPTSKDSASLENLKAYIERTMGVVMPDEEIKNTTVFDSSGKYLKDVTSMEVQGAIMAGVERPDYQHISCPALSIYAAESTTREIFPFYDSLDAENKKKADTCIALFGNLAKEQMEIFRKEVKNGTVKELKGAHHYVFVSHPLETEQFIREFLK